MSGETVQGSIHLVFQKFRGSRSSCLDLFVHIHVMHLLFRINSPPSVTILPNGTDLKRPDNKADDTLSTVGPFLKEKKESNWVATVNGDSGFGVAAQPHSGKRFDS